MHLNMQSLSKSYVHSFAILRAGSPSSCKGIKYTTSAHNISEAVNTTQRADVGIATIYHKLICSCRVLSSSHGRRPTDQDPVAGLGRRKVLLYHLHVAKKVSVTVGQSSV